MPPSSTRRRFLLAAGGAAALAGCSELRVGRGDGGETISVVELPEVPDEDESQPIVRDALPVDIERARLDESAGRVEALLDTLPVPLEPADVPNGHARNELVEAAEAATERLDEARSASTRLSAMESLSHARTEARYAAAGWAFVDRGRTKAELRTERRETAAEAESVRSDQAYVGADPARAAVVHANVEGHFRAVQADAGRPVRTPGELLTVAELGDHAESARAHLEDGRYLYDRYRASLSADVGTVRSTLESAAESLTADLQERRESLPPEPTSDGDPADRLRNTLRSDAARSARYATDAGPPASTVLRATEGLVDFLAFERLRERLDEGEQFQPETGADVRAARSQALSSIRSALEKSDRPALVREPVARMALLVTRADREIARIRRDVPPGRLDGPIRRYATATLRARSAPAACELALEALES